MNFIKIFVRNFLVGVIAGTLTIPLSPSVAHSRFLLPQNKKNLREEPKPQAKTVDDFDQAVEKAKFIRYQQDRWNEMRRRLESGEALIPKTEKPLPTAERKSLPQPPPMGPGINVVLPYESGLSISGRKVIDFKLSSTIYDQPDSGKGRVNKTDFSLDQQLQVRVKGTVGRKVTVNVDFDDTREDKRDISVVYKGDPDEILQEAAFGDISISLPSTEFVGYSKSVFGARAQLQFRPRTGFARLFPSHLWHRYTPKEIKMYLIGSRTKGITQTKRFTGQSVLQRKELNDINYQRRQFYFLAFSTSGGTEDRPIQVGSEKIFLDDQNPNNNNVNETTRTFKVVESTLTDVGGINPSTMTYIGPTGTVNTGVFKLLVPGVDYTVDYVKGVVRFKRTIQQRDVIVADYIPTGQALPISQIGFGSPRGGTERDNQIIDPANDTLQGWKPFLLKPDETQFFATRELKNYYNLGDTKILRDDGRGNFILKIIDVNRSEPTEFTWVDSSTQTRTKIAPKYPNDIDVDFESGIFSFVSTDSYHTPNLRPFPEDIYTFKDAVPTYLNRYRIFAEYRFRKGNFNLDQTNIVSQSEQVFVDGRKMTRDVDYFIDYDVGIVSFFRPDVVRDDSIVEITYDYSPFGGQGEETLVGLRTEFYVTDNFFIGGSCLFNFAPRSRGVPDLRSTSRSITVLESDFNWKNIKFGKFPIQITNLAAEVAQSIKNPNTADKALIESFEGVKLEDAANMNKDSWQAASNPEKGNPDTGGAYQKKMVATALTLSNEDVRITDVNPGAIVETSDRFQTLRVDYNFKSSDPAEKEAASIVNILSRDGLDFYTNRRQFLELWIFGDGSNAKLQFRLGGISEQADNSGVLKTEDKDRNGSLTPGEDAGWDFINPDGSTTTIGAGNGRVDTEDLNGNGRLDPDDNLGNYNSEIGTVNNLLVEPSGVTHTSVDWSGWKIFQVPLNIATTAQSDWSTIKHLRMTVVNPANAPKSGTILLGRAAVVGTRFEDVKIEPSTGTVTAQVFAENNQDNPGYPSLVSHPAYQSLYDLDDTSIKKREQSLAIQYQRKEIATVYLSTVSTREVFSKALDFSEHESFNFFLYGDGSNSEFFIRIGNPGNYFEYKTSLGFTGWRNIELDILDKNRDGQLDRNEMRPFGQWTKRVGSPSLRNITEITMGVYVPTGGPDPLPNKIYVNEIHLTGAVKITGIAYRANTAFTWDKWATWGASWRFVDRNFQTLTSVGSGQDSKSGNAYFNLNRMAFLPLNTNMNYSETVTPQIQTLNDPNILVSVIDEGKSISTSQNLSGNLLMTQLPLLPYSVKSKLLNVDFSADHSLSIRSAADREDESFNYRYGTSYAVPWRPDILPTTFLTFRPLPTSLSYSFSQTNSYQRIKSENTDTRSVGESYSFSTAFQFIPQMSLTPSYSMSRAFEERDMLDISTGVSPSIYETLGRYHKNRNQSASVSGSLRLISWFTPNFSYSINTGESYNMNTVVFGTASYRRGEVKSITRSSNGDLSASFSPKDIFQYIPYVRAVNYFINSLSFSGGYNIADGDNYENIGSGFETRFWLKPEQLVIRQKNLDISSQNPNARRTSLTATDSNRLSGRWSPFEGFTFLRSRLWNPLKNINTSGTFTETKTKRDATGTETFSYSKVWPDFIFSTSEIERPLFLSRWMTDTRLNANYQERLSEVIGQTRSRGFNMGSDFTFTLFKLLQFSVSYTDSISQEEDLKTNKVTSRTRSKGMNGQVITTLKWGNWRFTPRYDQSQSESEDGTGKKTSDLVNRNASLQIFGDVNIPRFFRMPFGKQLTLTNRLILTASARYSMVRDGVDETKSRDVLDTNMNGDFEITPNIRAAFGGGYGRTMNKAKKEEDFSTLTFTTRITIQF